MQLKYLVGLCLVSATLALPVVDGDGGHYGGNHDGGSGGGGGKCKTGPVQCCDSVQSSKSSGASSLLGLLGVVLNSNIPVGISCNNIGVLGGNSCNAQTVCCEDNTFNGVIALGCTPINLNL